MAQYAAIRAVGESVLELMREACPVADLQLGASPKFELASLGSLTEGQAPPVVAPIKPAVSVKKSLTAEYIVCLEDGKKFKSLKRHLRTQYNMTPEQYRDKWGLPADYPMVAPNYAVTRSQLAKKMGLGQARSGKR